MTREAITDAVADVIREQGIDFSVQDVADRAGVTHRTVYRHFEGREALVDAIGERFEEWLADQGITEPETLDAIGWYLLSSQFGLSGARSGPAVRRTLEAVIADLRKRNDEAAAGG